jgi:hypothetical protein
MRTFALSKMDEIRANRYTFQKLLINGKCLLDDYENEIRTNPVYLNNFQHIGLYMQRFADGSPLTIKQFNEIKDKKLKTLKVRCFEFKKGDLRVYALSSSNNQIIILGGYKNSQIQDINQLISIVSDYISTLKAQTQ